MLEQKSCNNSKNNPGLLYNNLDHQQHCWKWD